MRKKYLSALLFGALLVTSAGTFTSCKDYDDEINGLQEQINEIKTTLSELEEQIGATGVSSVTFDEATGMLTVVDASGSKSYKIQTSAEVAIDGTISEDGILTINGKEIGKVFDGGDIVTVDEDNNLLVNDEIVASLGGGNYVTMIKNEANKTVILKQGDETVTLPYGADAAVTPSVEFDATTDNTGIWNVAWGVAASDITFGDTTYKTGDLLLGGMTQSAKVTVKPITYDLSAQTLKLIDIDGNYAKVKVVPTTEEETGTTSRAMVSANGEWKLSLVMDESVTAENVETAFTKKVNGVDQNLKYALTVNGTRVTGYEFVIDTDTKNESEAREAVKKDAYKNAKAEIEAGETTLSVADFDKGTPKVDPSTVVASTMTLNDIDAEAAGVKVEGMKVTVPTGFTGEDFDVKLTILDVTGAKSEHAVKIDVKASTVEEVSQVEQVEVAISKDGTFVVKFDDIFSKLDANTVTAITGAKITTTDGNFFALTSATAADGIYTVVDGTTNSSSVSFSKKDDGTLGDNKVELDGEATVRSIKSAKVTLAHTTGTSTKYTTAATNSANLYGTFKLTLSLLAGENTIKKIEIPVKVVEPSFSDYYKPNTFMGWDSEGNVSKVFTGNIELSKDYYLNANGTAVGDTPTLNVTFNKFTSAEDGDEVDAAATLDADEVIKTDETTNIKSLGIKELKATATATVATVTLQPATTSGSTVDEPITVKHEFKVKLAQQFDGAKLVYFNDGVKEDKASVFNNGTVDYIQAYYKSTPANDEAPAKYTGLAIEYNGKYIPVANAEYTIDNYTINANASSLNAYTLNYEYDTADGSQGTIDDLTINCIKFSDSIDEVGQGGKLVLTFTDNTGLNYQAGIEYVKTNIVKNIVTIADK